MKKLIELLEAVNKRTNENIKLLSGNIKINGNEQEIGDKRKMFIENMSLSLLSLYATQTYINKKIIMSLIEE